MSPCRFISKNDKNLPTYVLSPYQYTILTWLPKFSTLAFSLYYFQDALGRKWIKINQKHDLVSITHQENNDPDSTFCRITFSICLARTETDVKELRAGLVLLQQQNRALVEELTTRTQSKYRIWLPTLHYLWQTLCINGQNLTFILSLCLYYEFLIQSDTRYTGVCDLSFSLKTTKY